MVGCINCHAIQNKGAKGPLEIFEFIVHVIILPRLALARRDSSIYNPACDAVVYSGQVCASEDWEWVIEGKKGAFS